jgi:hypothetical protein
MPDRRYKDCGSSVVIDGVDERIFCQRKFGHKKHHRAFWSGATPNVAYRITFKWGRP